MDATLTCRYVRDIAAKGPGHQLIAAAYISATLAGVDEEYVAAGKPALDVPNLPPKQQRTITALMHRYAARHLDEPIENAIRSAVAIARDAFLPRAKPTVR